MADMAQQKMAHRLSRKLSFIVAICDFIRAKEELSWMDEVKVKWKKVERLTMFFTYIP
jgi:hypothetical protein